jgi:hypothetical protein
MNGAHDWARCTRSIGRVLEFGYVLLSEHVAMLYNTIRFVCRVRGVRASQPAIGLYFAAQGVYSAAFPVHLLAQGVRDCSFVIDKCEKEGCNRWPCWIFDFQRASC